MRRKDFINIRYIDESKSCMCITLPCNYSDVIRTSKVKPYDSHISCLLTIWKYVLWYEWVIALIGGWRGRQLIKTFARPAELRVRFFIWVQYLQAISDGGRCCIAVIFLKAAKNMYSATYVEKHFSLVTASQKRRRRKKRKAILFFDVHHLGRPNQHAYCVLQYEMNVLKLYMATWAFELTETTDPETAKERNSTQPDIQFINCNMTLI